MLITENTKLIQEKNNLMIKLDKNNYKTQELREVDEKRYGKIEREIKSNLQKYLTKSKTIIARKVQKVTSMKEAKKLLKEKYQAYREVTINARNFVNECVDKKKEGRDLMERVVAAKGKEDKKLIGDILRL